MTHRHWCTTPTGASWWCAATGSTSSTRHSRGVTRASAPRWTLRGLSTPPSSRYGFPAPPLRLSDTFFRLAETLVSVAEFSTAAVTEARRVGCTGADARVDVAHQDVQELPREEVHPSQLRRRGDPRWPAAVRTLRGVHLLLRLGRVPRHPPHRRGGEGHLVGGERRAGELLAEASRSHPVASHPPPSTVSHTTSPTTIFHRCVCGSSPTPNVICTSALIRHRGTVCACNHLSLSLSAALRLVV
jgi:hypothetical protein